jgi:hypothetical protein
MTELKPAHPGKYIIQILVEYLTVMNRTEEYRTEQLCVYSLLTIALTGIELQIIQVAQVQYRHEVQRRANTQQHFEIDISNLIVLPGGGDIVSYVKK